MRTTGLPAATTFSKSSCWRPGRPRLVREAASPVIQPASSPRARMAKSALPAAATAAFRSSSAASLIPAPLAYITCCSPIRFARAARKEMTSSARPKPPHDPSMLAGSSASGPISAISRTAFDRGSNGALLGPGEFFSSTNDRSAAVRASSILSGCNMAPDSLASSA